MEESVKCNKCNKDKDVSQFMANNKQFKTCFECREQSRKWRENNKEVVSLYNIMSLSCLCIILYNCPISIV